MFKPYSFSQVKEILVNRLGALELEIFHPTAIELLARRASSVAGDIRAALKICQRYEYGESGSMGKGGGGGGVFIFF